MSTTFITNKLSEITLEVFSQSNVWNPVGVIFRSEFSGDEQDDVDDPPDAEATHGQELSDGGARLSEAEPVEAQKPEEDGVEEGRQEVVVRVLDARVPVA